jgi:septal ring factor EnvC (AmiA/AmiB activator)
MAETPSIRINMALALGLIALVGAGWTGYTNVRDSGKAEQAFENRIALMENTIAQGDIARADRRAVNAATLGAMAARISSVEEAARVANLAADRLAAKQASTDAAMATTNQQMAKFADAISELTKQQAVTNALLSEIKDQLKGLRP